MTYARGIKHSRAVYGPQLAQTEAYCCAACGQVKPLLAAGMKVWVKGFEYKGSDVPLTPLETDAFRILAKSFGTVVHKSRMHAAIYAADEDGGAHEKITDVLICKLRRKIRAAAVPLEIKTVWGVGYQLLALPVGI